MNSKAIAKLFFETCFWKSLKAASYPGVSVCQKTTNRGNPGAMHHGKDRALSQCIMGRLKPKNETARSHSRTQRPRSFWSAPRIATSGHVQHRKSAIHGLPVTPRMLRVKSDKYVRNTSDKYVWCIFAKCSSSCKRGVRWQKMAIRPISIEDRPRLSTVSWFALFVTAMTCSRAILLTNLQITGCCRWPRLEFLGWILWAISISEIQIDMFPPIPLKIQEQTNKEKRNIY